MATDPRAALNRLIAALEQHFEASSTGDEFSPAVIAAEDRLADAFCIELPLDIVEADEDEDDDFDEEDFEDDEDEDYDVDDYEDDEDIDEEEADEDDEDEAPKRAN